MSPLYEKTYSLSLMDVVRKNMRMNDEWNELVSQSDNTAQASSFDELCESSSVTDLAFRPLTAEDVIIALIGGFAGALSSYALVDTFNKVHGCTTNNKEGYKNGYIDWYGKQKEKAAHPVLHQLALFLRHTSSAMDKLPGTTTYGTLNHRLKYGHDLFNPMEIWSEMTKQYGGNGKAAMEWVRHLVADTFSKEGLPLPGHSFFRETILNALGDDWSKYITIKARDVTGAALVSAILFAHDGYMKHVKKVDNKQTYSRYQRNMIAYSTCLMCGLMLGSLNYAALVLFTKNSIQLLNIDRRISRNLDASLTDIRKEIEAPVQFGRPFAEMIQEPSGQVYTPEQYREFVGLVPMDNLNVTLT